MTGRRGPNAIVATFLSDVTPIDQVITLDNLDTTRAHGFVGVQFFADEAGLVEAVPSAGTISIEIMTLNTRPRLEPIPQNIIQAATPRTLSWAANTIRLRATPSGIDTATHWRAIVTMNET